MTLKDQINRVVTIPEQVSRIVCLVPSITELLVDLGIGDKLVGRTKFCVLPVSLKRGNSVVVGGTKQVHYDRIHNLKPDLVLCNKEENTEEIVAELQKHYPIYVSNVQTIHSAIDMIADIGLMTGLQAASDLLISDIESQREAWGRKGLSIKKVIYLIWKNPWMTIGRDTFIFHMLEEAGFQSVVYDLRYPTLTNEEIQQSSADFVFMSSEPYPFKQTDLEEIAQISGMTKPILVDGTYFSWYGSRIAAAYGYFEQLHERILEVE